ncbi:hypothetical protein LINGRAHAP2_LOCUS32178, partial [Linum grandiflorum]
TRPTRVLVPRSEASYDIFSGGLLTNITSEKVRATTTFDKVWVTS